MSVKPGQAQSVSVAFQVSASVRSDGQAPRVFHMWDGTNGLWPYAALEDDAADDSQRAVSAPECQRFVPWPVPSRFKLTREPNRSLP